MNALPFPARTGSRWLREGFALMRRQPFALIALVILYFMVLVLCTRLPALLAFSVTILIPGLSVGFMRACQLASRQERITPLVFTEAFFANQKQRAVPLLKLGVFYLLVSLLLAAVLGWLVDMEQLFIMAQKGELWWLQLVVSIVSVPLLILYWYPPLLVAWHALSPVKALFFSGVVLWRNLGAFLMLGLHLLGFSILLSFAAALLGLALGKTVMILASYTLAAVMITLLVCCVYTSYRDILQTGADAAN